MNAGAEIHDLGHAAYTGPRMPPSRRFLVVAANVMAVSWRRWAVRIPLILAACTTIGASTVMYFLRMSLMDVVRANGVQIPRAEFIVYMAGIFYEMSAFLLAVLVACPAIADDLTMGAFQFYFARALRPRDYVAGKLLGLAMVIGIPMFFGPLVLSIMRLVFADSLSQAGTLLDVVPRAMLHGLVGTAAYVLPAAGVGALAGRRQAGQALFAVYLLLLTPAAMGLSVALRVPLLRVLSIPNDLAVVGAAIFGAPQERYAPPVIASATWLAILCALGFLAVWRRVRGAETAGLVSQ